MSVKQFVNDIEEHIYKKELIYRTLLIAANSKEANEFKKELDKKDYSVQWTRTIEPTYDYNAINERILVIPAESFKDFLRSLEENSGGFAKSSYNFIGISYSIADHTTNCMIELYVSKTNNNIYDTIIFDQNYAKFLYLDSIKK